MKVAKQFQCTMALVQFSVRCEAFSYCTARARAGSGSYANKRCYSASSIRSSQSVALGLHTHIRNHTSSGKIENRHFSGSPVHASPASSSSSSSSSFVPPDPPAFQGQPMFPDVAIHNVSEAAMMRNQDGDAVFVVTGASRGIGLQIVKTLFSRTEGTIIACCRSPANAEGLHAFVTSLSKVEAGRVSIQPLDLEDQESIEDLASRIKEEYNRVDVLMNVAGILGDGSTTPGPERSLRGMDREWTMKSFNVNYIGPVFLSQACAPMMRRGKDGSKSVIANLSARVGSISDNGLGGWISYRSSKAALNQATRTAALELKRQGTYAITLHPGTTNTDLSKPFQKNVREDRLFPVDFTAGRMIDVIDGMEEDHTGGFYDWSGKALPF